MEDLFMLTPDHFPALATFAAAISDADLAALVAGVGPPPKQRMGREGDPDSHTWASTLAAALGGDEASWVARIQAGAPASAIEQVRQYRAALEWTWSTSRGVALHRKACGAAFDLAEHLASLADCGIDVDRHYGATQALRAFALLRAAS
jgi:hypothetical protein